MVLRKGPLLLEIIDLELTWTSRTFSSCIHTIRCVGWYLDVGRNPTNEVEITILNYRSADLPTGLNWAQISSNYLYMSVSGKPQLQKYIARRPAGFVSYFGVGKQIG